MLSRLQGSVFGLVFITKWMRKYMGVTVRGFYPWVFALGGKCGDLSEGIWGGGVPGDFYPGTMTVTTVTMSNWSRQYTCCWANLDLTLNWRMFLIWPSLLIHEYRSLRGYIITTSPTSGIDKFVSCLPWLWFPWYHDNLEYYQNIHILHLRFVIRGITLNTQKSLYWYKLHGFHVTM